MLIDCDDCAMQHSSACDDCVVTFILATSGPLEIDSSESAALANLATEGLVPTLRLVSRRDDDPPERAVGG